MTPLLYRRWTAYSSGSTSFDARLWGPRWVVKR